MNHVKIQVHVPFTNVYSNCVAINLPTTLWPLSRHRVASACPSPTRHSAWPTNKTEGASCPLNACPSLRNPYTSPGPFSEWTAAAGSARLPPADHIGPLKAWYEWRWVVCVVLVWWYAREWRYGRALAGARPPPTMCGVLGKRYPGFKVTP